MFEASSNHFTAAFSQWNDDHPNPDWRQQWINEAEKWQEKIP